MNCGLEICIDSLESAKNAILGGADQIEVCSSLALGGLTPTVGLVRAVRKFDANIPLMCMIRSRHGDFVNTEDEFEVLVEDIKALKEAGASGFVFGCLDFNNNLDLPGCKRLLEAASPLPSTLHRAFDLTSNWTECMDAAVKLGFTSILTSGQESTATAGLQCLKKVIELSKDKIRILVGSGVNSKTLPLLLSTLGTDCWYHASASVALTQVPSRIPMGPADNLGPKKTCQEETQTIQHIIRAFKESQ